MGRRDEGEFVAFAEACRPALRRTAYLMCVRCPLGASIPIPRSGRCLRRLLTFSLPDAGRALTFSRFSQRPAQGQPAYAAMRTPPNTEFSSGHACAGERHYEPGGAEGIRTTGLLIAKDAGMGADV
jgi:hypothetical protein